jgi:hypothetical protein
MNWVNLSLFWSLHFGVRIIDPFTLQEVEVFFHYVNTVQEYILHIGTTVSNWG